MSGHSKWHNIQKTKGAADAKRSAAFTKIAKEIIVAVKQGGSGDPNNNSRLATVIAKAKAANMPNDNIKRTIDKALGSGNTDNYESVTYEGYGPCGVAVIVEALTDNRQRTAPEIRHYFDKFGKGRHCIFLEEILYCRLGACQSPLRWAGRGCSHEDSGLECQRLCACKRKSFCASPPSPKQTFSAVRKSRSGVRFPLQGVSGSGTRPNARGTRAHLTLARREPSPMRYGMGIGPFDDEGRLILLEYNVATFCF